MLDYRQEGILRFTVREQDGYGYGECIFASAIITQDKDMSGDFTAVEAFLETSERNISDLVHLLNLLKRRR